MISSPYGIVLVSRDFPRLSHLVRNLPTPKIRDPASYMPRLLPVQLHDTLSYVVDLIPWRNSGDGESYAQSMALSIARQVTLSLLMSIV